MSDSNNFLVSIRVAAVFVFTGLLATVITVVIYQYTQNLLTDRLKDRLVAIAATAATQFDSDDIEKIWGPEDMDSPEYIEIVDSLNAIRDANNNIQYAYLMRRTEDPNMVEFVADADSLASDEELDANENGILDEDEMAPYPGDPYEVAEYPVLRDEAFYYPAVDRELQEDQWGLIMAAYAPIKNLDNDIVAIIGIDVLVEDFQERTQSTLLPFLLFIFLLILLLTLLTLLLIRFYGERVEAMREIDRQKDELLSIVSHQLATPISSMKWYLEMILDGDLGKLKKEQEDHLKSLQGIAGGMTDLVGMILDVSRIQLGRMKVDRHPLNLDEFFQNIQKVIEPRAKRKNITFNVSLPKKLPVALLDKRLTRMTLINLLNNAVKYTPEDGSVSLNVKTSDGKLRYSVSDTGCGIPKEDQPKLFGKLYRASNVQKVDGNGFGLYIAKGAVEAQGGEIAFDSRLNKGTTFNVEIPFEEQA